MIQGGNPSAHSLLKIGFAYLLLISHEFNPDFNGIVVSESPSILGFLPNHLGVYILKRNRALAFVAV